LREKQMNDVHVHSLDGSGSNKCCMEKGGCYTLERELQVKCKRLTQNACKWRSLTNRYAHPLSVLQIRMLGTSTASVLP